jgi:hypothetical protein
MHVFYVRVVWESTPLPWRCKAHALPIELTPLLLWVEKRTRAWFPKSILRLNGSKDEFSLKMHLGNRDQIDLRNTSCPILFIIQIELAVDWSTKALPLFSFQLDSLFFPSNTPSFSGAKPSWDCLASAQTERTICPSSGKPKVMHTTDVCPLYPAVA